MSLQCPRCGQIQHCGCVNCTGRNRGKITYSWDGTGEFCICGRCEFTAHADWWLDEEFRQNWQVIVGSKYRPKARNLATHVQALSL